MKRGMKRRRLPLANHGAGFTLIEVLVATSASLILFLAIFQIIVEVGHMAQIMITKVRLNQEARQVLRMTLDGGVRQLDGNGTIVNGERERGLHGRNIVAELLDPNTNKQQLIWSVVVTELAGSPTRVIGSTRTPEFEVTCADIDDPIAVCGAGGETYDVAGLVAEWGVVDSRAVTDNFDPDGAGPLVPRNVTRELNLVVTDPGRLPLVGQERDFLISEFTERYSTVVTLHVDN